MSDPGFEYPRAERRPKGYPRLRIEGRWAICWRKRFVLGILEGISVWERLSFVDRWHCAMWLKGVRRNIRNGELPWVFDGRPTSALSRSGSDWGCM